MRFVDHWQISQPLHLRHLAVIRDTALVGKTPHYVHYTYGNFKSLVDKGIRSWEAVAETTYNGRKKAKGAVPSPEAKADLDEFGFPRISAAAFQGAQNDATLGDCVDVVKTQSLSLGGGGRKGRPSIPKTKSRISNPPNALEEASHPYQGK